MNSLPKNCEIFVTQDGSPTLIWTSIGGYSEKMHHSGGALSESFFVYHRALEMLIESGWPVRILSVGLGLGYNELIALGELHNSGVRQFQIWSFEAEAFLRDRFRDWLSGSAAGQLHSVYDQVLTAVAGKLSLPPDILKTTAFTAFDRGDLQLRERFPETAAPMDGVSCVFYDAYSNKMDPALWDEASLERELAARIGPQCILATYAATGSLNRALKALGFRLMPRKGFLGKRESTLAIRG